MDGGIDMGIRCRDVMDHMEAWALLNLCEEWDNSGLLIGDPQKEVKKVLVALDVTVSTAERAITDKVDMIVSHHPLIFNPIKSIFTHRPFGHLLRKILCSDTAVYAAHTNLDRCRHGVNDELARRLGMKNIKTMDADSGLGRIGDLKHPAAIDELVERIKSNLQVPYVKVVGEVSGTVTRIADLRPNPQCTFANSATSLGLSKRKSTFNPLVGE